MPRAFPWTPRNCEQSPVGEKLRIINDHRDECGGSVETEERVSTPKERGCPDKSRGGAVQLEVSSEVLTDRIQERRSDSLKRTLPLSPTLLRSPDPNSF